MAFGLVAALFWRLSGFHIQYSQEARPYSLLFFPYFAFSSFYSLCL